MITKPVLSIISWADPMKFTHFSKNKVHFERISFACTCRPLNLCVCEFGLSCNAEQLTLLDLISPKFCAFLQFCVYCDLQDITTGSLLGWHRPFGEIWLKIRVIYSATSSYSATTLRGYINPKATTPMFSTVRTRYHFSVLHFSWVRLCGDRKWR